MLFVFRLFTLSTAFSDRTMMETPGGQARTFCDPVIIISAFTFSMSKGSARKEDTQSQTKNK